MPIAILQVNYHITLLRFGKQIILFDTTHNLTLFLHYSCIRNYKIIIRVIVIVIVNNNNNLADKTTM